MAKIGAGRKQIRHLSPRILVNDSTWVHLQLQRLALLLLLLGLGLTPSLSTSLVVTKQPVRVKEVEQAAQSADLWAGAMAPVQRMILVPGHDCLDLALP